MRISYMYYLIKQSLENLKSIERTEEKSKGGTTWIVFSNYSLLKTTLENLSDLTMFKDDIDDIYKYLPNTNRLPNDKFRCLNNEGTAIYNYLQNLTYHLNVIVNFLEMLGFNEQQLGFDVKMPPTEDFDEFVNNISMLQKILNQCPYLNIDGEVIKIQSVDIGSIWFEFAVIATGASILLHNLAKLVDKCVKIRSHYLTTKHQEEVYRKLNIENDFLEKLVAINEKIYNKFVDDAIEELKTDIPNVPLTNEDKNRVQFTLKNLITLMDKGMEIYASIDAPDEVKELFPTTDKVQSLVDPIKLLPDSDTAENNE